MGIIVSFTPRPAPMARASRSLVGSPATLGRPSESPPPGGIYLFAPTPGGLPGNGGICGQDRSVVKERTISDPRSSVIRPWIYHRLVGECGFTGCESNVEHFVREEKVRLDLSVVKGSFRWIWKRAGKRKWTGARPWPSLLTDQPRSSFLACVPVIPQNAFYPVNF